MAAVYVPEASCANLCEELGKELETHCFVHIVEIDEVANYAVPTFQLVFEAKLQHVRDLVGVRKSVGVRGSLWGEDGGTSSLPQTPMN